MAYSSGAAKKRPRLRGTGLQPRARSPFLVDAVRVAELLGVAVPGEAVGLVDLGGELFGEGVVQLAAGVVQQGGGVGEDLRAAGLRGGLGEDLDLAVGVDGEDGQVGELGFGELTDVRGGDEVHDPVLPVGPWGCSPGRVSGARLSCLGGAAPAAAPVLLD